MRLSKLFMPVLDDANGDEVAMNAPSRTFDLGANAFDDDYFPDVVRVDGGCNNCHDALATSFHSGKRGGNIKICKMCHVPSNGGSHLEMQSRSIDSYVHAIHSFRVFDIGEIDESDPVEALEHQHKIQSEFPKFGIMNCEACHNPGMYGVPDQSKSLPGVLSGSDDVADRNIGTVPSVVTGPAARACGACHRAQMINEDDAGKLAAFNEHTKVFGYRVEDGDGVWEAVIEEIMSLF
jgi:OmcA/MtrC family decaheme c-type cytochrome